MSVPTPRKPHIYTILALAIFGAACFAFRQNIDKFVSLASLLVSSAAFVAVSVSLNHQVRQVKIARDENIRTQHRELLVMSINDPSLRKCWGGSHSSMANRTEEEQRQAIFTNLIFFWYYSAYLIEDINDDQLRINLTGFFRGEIGRSYWASGRTRWLALVNATASDRKKQFMSIADGCYEVARARDGGS